MTPSGGNQRDDDNGPRGQNTNDRPSNKMVFPTSPKGPLTSPFGPRWGRMHEGLDIGVPDGTNVVAVLDGTVEFAGANGGYGNYLKIKHSRSTSTAYAHLESFKVSVGDDVKQGDVVALSNNTGSSTGPHLHFEVYVNDIPVDPDPYLTGAETVDGAASSGSGGVGNVGAGGESLAKAAAFATFFQLTTVQEMSLSQTLTGEKSLMNDKPLFPFIQQLTEASLRNFQSMPNGNFYAFYPDYFGGMGHRKPYWKIRDIEIIDGSIDLSDASLATHVYIVGSTLGSWEQSVGMPEQLSSSGVVTVFNAFMVNFLDGNFAPELDDPYEDVKPGKKAKRKSAKHEEEWKKNKPELTDKDNAIAFLKKYGARPHMENMPMIRSPYYELFLAYQRFCLLWAEQFSTTFELTFMPELFPGGLIEFEEHGIQCYVESVSHNCSYSGGFTTSVVLSAPASTRQNTGKPDPLKKGLIRAGIFGPDGPKIEEPKTPTRGDAGE
jgi:hypothetical protein